MKGRRNLVVVLAVVLCTGLLAGPPREAAAQAKPEGEMRWALYVTLSPTWSDPAEVIGVLTPSLAESWTVSPDQRVYEFKLREGLKFHNGDPFTAEDVQFSFQRAKGDAALMQIDPYPWSAPLEEVKLRKR